MLRTALIATLLTSLPAAQAQLAPAPFLLGGEHQLSSDLDEGGSFSRSAARARVSAPLFLGEDTLVGLSLGYQFENFQFDDLMINPWGDIHRVRLGLVAKQDFADGWSWLALPYVASNAESGADWGEALTFGGLAATWYQFSEKLSFGLGFGINSELEDNLGFFPIVVIDWKLTDNLTLTTIPPEGFRLGPGAALRWDVRDDLSLSLVYQYQSDQHRLAEDSLAAANGLGELRQNRVALAATYHLNENFSLTGHAGMTIGGTLELLDEAGEPLSETEFDSSLVFGLEGSFRF